MIGKFGKGSDAIDALDKIETKPDSKGRQEVLLEELEGEPLMKDPEFTKLAGMLKQLLDEVGANVSMQLSINQSGSNNRVNVAGRDINTFEKQVIRPIVQPNEHHITEKQSKQIKDKIQEISEIDEKAGKGKSYGELQRRLKDKFECTSYKTLLAEHFEDAMKWLRQEAGVRTKSLRRKDNPAWRYRQYATIKTAGKAMGLSNEEQYLLITERLKLPKVPTSLKDLGEQKLGKAAALFRRLSKVS